MNPDAVKPVESNSAARSDSGLPSVELQETGGAWYLAMSSS